MCPNVLFLIFLISEFIYPLWSKKLTMLFPSFQRIRGDTGDLWAMNVGTWPPQHIVLSSGLWGRHFTFLGLSFPICNADDGAKWLLTSTPAPTSSDRMR